jgi:hypothetical protein
LDGNFVIKVTIHVKKVVRESRNLGPSETAPFGCRYGEELARSQKSKALRVIVFRCMSCSSGRKRADMYPRTGTGGIRATKDQELRAQGLIVGRGMRFHST